MKRLFTLSLLLLFSFNTISEEKKRPNPWFEEEEADSAEKKNPFDAWFSGDDESSVPISREYNQQIECFSNGKKIIDIDDVYVSSYDKNSITYYTKNGWGDIDPIRSDVTCHISFQEGWFN